MRTHKRGFTLVELSVIVVIVGILATLAVVGYRKIITSSRMTEGVHAVSGIVAAQEAHKAESGQYVDINAATPCWYPKAPGRYVTQWGGTCPCCARQWTQLTFTPSAPVAFGYATTAGSRDVTTPPAGDVPVDPGPGGRSGEPPDGNLLFTGGGDAITLPDAPGKTTGPWFIVAAQADFDGDPTRSSKILYDSDSHLMVTANDGE